jgi:hypothetical protein
VKEPCCKTGTNLDLPEGFELLVSPPRIASIVGPTVHGIVLHALARPQDIINKHLTCEAAITVGVTVKEPCCKTGTNLNLPEGFELLVSPPRIASAVGPTVHGIVLHALARLQDILINKHLGICNLCRLSLPSQASLLVRLCKTKFRHCKDR